MNAADLAKTKNAVRTALAATGATLLALRLNWEYPHWAGMAALTLMTPYQGGTLHDVPLRIAAALTGSAFGYVTIACYPQSHVGLLLAVAAFLGLSGVFAGLPTFRTFALVTGLTYNSVVAFGITNFDGAFQTAYYRAGEFMLGAVVIACLDLALFPNRADHAWLDQFEQALRGLAGQFAAWAGRGAETPPAGAAEAPAPAAADPRRVAVPSSPAVLGAAVAESPWFRRALGHVEEADDALETLTVLAELWRRLPAAPSAPDRLAAARFLGAAAARLRAQADELAAALGPRRGGRRPRGPGREEPLVRREVAPPEPGDGAAGSLAPGWPDLPARTREALSALEAAVHALATRRRKPGRLLPAPDNRVTWERVGVGLRTAFGVSLALLGWFYWEMPNPIAFVLGANVVLLVCASQPSPTLLYGLLGILLGIGGAGVTLFGVWSWFDYGEIGFFLPVAVTLGLFLRVQAAGPPLTLCGLLAGVLYLIALGISRNQSFDFVVFAARAGCLLAGSVTGLLVVVLLRPATPLDRFKRFLGAWLQFLARRPGPEGLGAASPVAGFRNAALASAAAAHFPVHERTGRALLGECVERLTTLTRWSAAVGLLAGGRTSQAAAEEKEAEAGRETPSEFARLAAVLRGRAPRIAPAGTTAPAGETSSAPVPDEIFGEFDQLARRLEELSRVRPRTIL